MLPKYDLSKLENVIYDFYRATGVSITLYDKDRTPLTRSGIGTTQYCRLIANTKEGARGCKKSNTALFDKCQASKSLEMHICAAGLLDAILPLLNGDELVGFLMIGQMRSRESLPENLGDFSVDLEMASDCYLKMPICDEKTVNSIINIGSMLAKYVIFENMVKPHQKPGADAVARYIEAHLTERLTAERVARDTHMSVSGIYKCMKSSFGCTLGEYITKQRIDRSLRPLEIGELSIEKIAESVGFTDPAYFSRCFKRLCGMSPLKYRKRFF